MSPEIELLLCCLRTPVTPQDQFRLEELLEQTLDWHQLLILADWHRVTPLLYWRLKEKGRLEAIPVAARSRLDQLFQQNLRHNFLLTTILLKVMQVLQRQTLRVLPFKGVLLAAMVYENLALRQVSDLDILIEKKDFEQTKQLLRQAGFYRAQLLTPQQEQLRLKSNYEDVWIEPQTQVSLDIHWGFIPPFFACQIPVTELLERAQPYCLSQTCLLSLDPCDLLLVLCVNGSKDGWLELQRLCDVAYCVQKYPQLDWSILLQRAKTYQCLRMVLLGLFLCQLVLKTPLPTQVQEAIGRDRVVQPLGQTLYQRLIQNTHQPITLVQRAYFPLQLQQGWENKLAYCAKLVLPINERDLESIHLPQWLFPLYYPLRLFRLLAKHGRDFKRD